MFYLSRFFPIALLSLSMATAAEAESSSHVTLLGPSMHPAGSSLSDDTLGFALGKSWQMGEAETFECMMEAGVFHNSYRETGPYAVAGCLRRITDLPIGNFYLGAALGTAYYPTLSKKLRSDYGTPELGGMIPLPLFNATYRLGNVDIRSATTFGGTSGKVISNLSLAVRF